MLFDYFMFSDSLTSFGNFFDYNSDESPHAVEAVLTLGDSDRFPLSLTTAMFLIGNDYNSVGDRAFSTYMELGCDFSIGHQPLYASTGFSTHEGLYSDGFEFVNIGLSMAKEIDLNETFS